MQRLVEIADVLVRAIDGQRVLNEVIRPDGEEVDLFRQDVGNQRGRRHLHHDPDFQVVVVVVAFLVQLRFDLTD